MYSVNYTVSTLQVGRRDGKNTKLCKLVTDKKLARHVPDCWSCEGYWLEHHGVCEEYSEKCYTKTISEAPWKKEKVTSPSYIERVEALLQAEYPNAWCLCGSDAVVVHVTSVWLNSF